MNNHDEIEEWRVIAEFPNYEVSNLGRVRSWAPLYAMMKRPEKPQFLTLQRNLAGYEMVGLSHENKHKGRTVHRLVATAFCSGFSPEKKLVRHLDGNPSNNRATNLAWGTHAENSEDQFRHGNANFGENATRAKLSNEQAKEIFNDGTSTCTELALKFGVCPTTISRIRCGKSRKRSGHEGVSPGAVGMGGRVTPQKITAEIAREIFQSTETARALAERYGISENFAYQIRLGLKWKSATKGLPTTERHRAYYGRALLTVAPLRNLTEDQVREIFLSPLNGRQIALKVGTTEGHVSMIRSRQVCLLITKELATPDRPKVQKLDIEKARAIFQTTGPLKETADLFGVSFNMVSLIRRRLSWAHATSDLPEPIPVA